MNKAGKYLDLGEFLESCNPLAFKKKDGSICYFRSYEDAYLEFLKRLYEAGPRYVDLVLFVMNEYGMTKAEGERFVKTWWSLGVRQDFVLTQWQVECEGDEHILRNDTMQICQGLHTLAETKFQKDMYYSAFDKYLRKVCNTPYMGKRRVTNLK